MASPIKILAVDDNEDALFALEQLLIANGFDVITATNGRDSLQRIRAHSPDLVLLDVVMPEPGGYEVTRIVKSDPALRFIPIVLLTSKDDLEDVKHGFDVGADDYIKKPFKQEELIARINAALRTRQIYLELRETSDENRELRSKTGQGPGALFSNIIGQSKPMHELLSLVERVKDADVPVLVTGESGTGKELIALALHYHSPRRDRPFVVQNCSALNENLLESELFGHVKGSFTGAIRDKQGLFEAADTGTFFLDELGEMSPGLQVKLLRVLQDGTFTPVGGTKSKKVDVRIVAATNRNLREMVKLGTFREDLFYRLNVVNIQLPPLRERNSDIPLLVDHFLAEHSVRRSRDRKQISSEALNILSGYSWPGNIRELQNEIERLIVMTGSDPVISAEWISPHIRSQAVRPSIEASKGGLKDALEHLEREMIVQTLERVNGNKSEAARELGISRSNLIAKVQSYGIQATEE